VRSRAEAAGLDCQVGISTRVERVIVLMIGLLLSPINNYILVGAIGLIAVLRTVTVVQRMMWVARKINTTNIK